MSGDLVNIGLPDEFTLGRRWIEALGNPHDVSLIPGNHDAYVGESLPAMLRTFPDTMASDGEVLPAFPYLRARGGVALIGVTTGVPTGPFMATGRIGGEQAGKLGRLLENARSKGLARVVMIHHPPHFSGSRWGRRLTDAHIAEAVLARHGAELVIHGHNHRHSAAWINGPSKRIPVIGVGSASAVPGSDEHRAQWQLYTIEDEGEAARISVEVRCRVAPGRVETIREFKLGG